MLTIDSSITDIKGIGEKLAAKYSKLNIFQVRDLITHFPKRYDRYGEIIPVSEVKEGDVVTIEVSLIGRAALKNIKNLKIVAASVRDASGVINITWFNMPFLARTLKPGTYYILRGRAARKYSGLTIEQPQIISKQEYFNKKNKLMPIYSITSGITNNNISKAVSFSLGCIGSEQDILPAFIRKKYNLVSYAKAIKSIHFPEDDESLKEARKRLVFEEFFRFIVSLRIMKTENKKNRIDRIYKQFGKCGALTDSLPYELTDAQKKAWFEIKNDMSSGYVMNRMVQGDVGSGKTIVAILALLYNCENGYQGAMMVPTEVLAVQHYDECARLLEPLGVNVALLTGSMTAKQKRNVYESISSGDADIVVGTHALIQDGVNYNNLGLVITDEQHRFGVNQRKNLSSRGVLCHTLVMSATPIPRSLALILYGDMEMSVIDMLPAGRIPIKNCVVDTSYRVTAYKFMEKQIAAGNQVYIICPMVEQNDDIEAESVIEYTHNLREYMPENIRIDALYGSMKNSEKNDIMRRFAEHQTDILVSTTVIEVGINVPNATVMMIENSDRFGLAQLHQLRGRVGRGNRQSYCIFMSGSNSKASMDRLKVLNNSNDGFHIASEDLKLRGPGELAGIRQSGELAFELGDIYEDADILKMVDEAVGSIDLNEFRDEFVHATL